MLSKISSLLIFGLCGLVIIVFVYGFYLSKNSSKNQLNRTVKEVKEIGNEIKEPVYEFKEKFKPSRNITEKTKKKQIENQKNSSKHLTGKASSHEESNQRAEFDKEEFDKTVKQDYRTNKSKKKDTGSSRKKNERRKESETDNREDKGKSLEELLAEDEQLKGESQIKDDNKEDRREAGSRKIDRAISKLTATIQKIEKTVGQ